MISIRNKLKICQIIKHKSITIKEYTTIWYYCVLNTRLKNKIRFPPDVLSTRFTGDAIIRK